jgi:hypothetical protein
MKRATLVLFIVGVVLELGGFLVSNAEEIPAVSRIVSRNYAFAKEGLATLETGSKMNTELLPGMRGFDQCAELYMTILRNQNPPESLRGVSVTRFFHPAEVTQVFDVNRGVRSKRPLEIQLSNGQKVHSTLESLQAKIEPLKSSSLFMAAAAIFGIGLAFHIAAFVCEHRSKSVA